MSTSATTARYLFDLDFDAEHRIKEEEQAEPTIGLYEHEAQMVALERRVRQEAHDAGHKQAMDEGAKALAQETQRLTGVATALLARLDEEIGAREERAVRIAISAAKKLARRLLDGEPIGEVELLFRQCLAPMFHASHLVVRMHADHVDAVRERLEGIASAQGFEGRLVFMGEEDLAPGDARIEWADGGLSRNQSALERTIDDLISGYLAARDSGQRSAHDGNAVGETHTDTTITAQALRASMEGTLDD